ncbi:hypothetical protein SYNPS1DRAFT_29851 [Syncephalis pseudoplumigaleata]|uniref:Uncharacterized protein n=1 Tax=Syncephalis pseudoplumigaleata TaxID=1712513 RepID=A0A4V1J1A5_9FUNG|nr:hypothetical protein SYNPS1DRAFT_29851 [Syncephalis pseudoplumigaleata]|eukprot:RKP24379.1 hypothetical protein SYNPS1DRAFT_29851 [Syncephalis pseudoplumigaleata]
MSLFGRHASFWIYRYILAVLLFGMLIAYLVLQLMHLLYPELSYRWSVEQRPVSVPSLFITGPRLLLDNCTITTLGQSSSTSEMVDLSRQVHLLDKGQGYIAAQNDSSVAWLLEPNPRWSLQPPRGIINSDMEFVHINITIQLGNPLLPVDPAMQQATWSDPPRIYVLDLSTMRLPIDLSLLETRPWVFAQWNRRNYVRYSEKHRLLPDGSQHTLDPSLTAAAVPFPVARNRIELILLPHLPTTQDGHAYLLETYRPYNGYQTSDFLERAALVLAIGLIALLAIFNTQRAKSIEPASPSEPFVSFEGEPPARHPAGQSAASKPEDTTFMLEEPSASSSNDDSLQTLSPPLQAQHVMLTPTTTKSGLVTPALVTHTRGVPVSPSAPTSDTSSPLQSEHQLDASMMMQLRPVHGRRYRYTAYSLQQSEDWLMNSQYHEGVQSEISFDVSDSDIAVARHTIIRSALSAE